jgi:stalled ribosome rescue protein Dom34
MKRVVAIWIDHKEAVIAAIADGAETTSRLESGVELGGGARGESGAEDQRDRRFANHLRTYYDAVIAQVKDAGGILLLGPGEAKHELEKRIRDEGLGERLVGVETTDKMTDHQVAASARERFQT